VIPILSNASQKEKDKKLLLKWRLFITNVLDDPNSNLSLLDAPCRDVLFDLEASMIQKNESKTLVANLWLNRTKLPLSPSTAGYFWEASELLESSNRKEDATTLWKLLSSSKDPNIEESKWATLKLDTEKTQYEDLWKDK
jgi:hypothetical protein